MKNINSNTPAFPAANLSGMCPVCTRNRSTHPPNLFSLDLETLQIILTPLESTPNPGFHASISRRAGKSDHLHPLLVLKMPHFPPGVTP
jgi:hypothetical protein